MRAARLARDADLTEELNELHRRGLPVVIIWSPRDTVVTEASVDALRAALADAHTISVPGGHSWLLGDPDRFGEVMTNVVAVAEKARWLDAGRARRMWRRVASSLATEAQRREHCRGGALMVRWKPGKRSTNIEDRRSEGPASGGGLGGLPINLPNFPIGGGKGCLGIGGGTVGLVVLLAVALLGGGNIFSGGSGSGGGFPVGPNIELPGAPAAQGSPLPDAPDPDAQLVDYMSFILDDVQRSWADEFSRANEQYEPAKLVLFTGAVNTGCGFAQSAAGPFYCPADSKVYLDLDFFRELRDRFGAPGDFAQAYVVAHELGHHVQNLLGIEAKVRRQQQRASRRHQRALRAPGAPGRLLRRRLGALDLRARHPAAGRRQGRARSRGIGR